MAAEQLRARGFQALSLTGGMKSWSLAWNSAELPLPRSKARVIQVPRTGKGCLSYLIASDGEAAVIDPALDPDVYLELAQENGWTIGHIFETHIHADHLSRARNLAERPGVDLRLPAQDQAAFLFHPIQDNDEFIIGAARLVVLRTPGHTSQPVAFDGQAIVASLAELSQPVELLHLSEAKFVETILARIPPTPPNHRRILELNEAGLWSDEDPTHLEAGANRCAVA